MARANVYTTEGKPKKSKKWLISLIVVLSLIVVAGVVVLILWGVGVFNKKDIPTYFTEYNEYKINYSQISTRTSETEMAYIFVYDNDDFDALSDANKTNVSKQVNDLITRIEAKNEEVGSDLISFYLLDAGASNNSSILENETYGNFSFTPQLLFFYDGTYYQDIDSAITAHSNLENTVPEAYKTLSFSASSIDSFVNVAINTKNFIRDYLSA